MFNFTNALDKNTSLPLYYQIRSLIFSEIQEGNVEIGDTIPTEKAFCEHYKVSRSTVRQAISELVQEGYLERKTNKGTIVTNTSLISSRIRAFEPFYQQISADGKTPRTELIDLSIKNATSEVAKNLGIEYGDKIIYLFRRRYADNKPMVTIQNFLPFNICEFILDHDLKKESLYEILTQNPDSKISKTKTIVSAEIATTEDIKLLQVKVGNPMLCFNTISNNHYGQIVDFAFSHYRGPLNKFEIDVKPEK